jgi:undecaprenyl-diphosphatase
MEFLDAHDQGFLYFVGQFHSPGGTWLDPVAVALTHLGEWWVLIPVVLLATLVLLRTGWRVRALAMLLGPSLAWGLEGLVKSQVKRIRPDVSWRVIELPGNSSFPSGHALNSMCVYALAGLLLAGAVPWPRFRRVLPLLGVGLGLLIGATRVWLGVHYPVDVLGGWTAGLGMALLAAGLAFWLEEKQKQASERLPSHPPATPSLPTEDAIKSASSPSIQPAPRVSQP